MSATKKRNYRFYICLTITLIILLLGFYFNNSFIRFWDSLKSLFYSIIYYFCEIFEIENEVNVTVNELPNYLTSTQLFFLPTNFEVFKLRIKVWFSSLFNITTLSDYASFIGNLLSFIAKGITIILPFILAIYLKIKDFFSESFVPPNEDSKYLKLYKKFEDKIFAPIKEWFVSFWMYILDHNFFLKIWIIVLAFYFNLISIVVSVLAYYFYFAVSFDLINLYIQFYKLLLDVSPMIRFVPTIIWIILILLLINHVRKNVAYNVLDHNEELNKEFISSCGLVAMGVGTMGLGKTSLITDMALSQEIRFRDEAFKLILENDLKFPFFPFINLEIAIKKAIEKHQVYNLETCRTWIRYQRKRCTNKYGLIKSKKRCFDYDYKKYGEFFDDGLSNIHLFDMLEDYVQLYFIYIIESSLIISNYSIRVDNVLEDLGNFPMWHSDFFRTNSGYMEAYSRHSHILDFDTLRLGKKVVENNEFANSIEFGVFVITEAGKERKNAIETKGLTRLSKEANQLNDLFNLKLKLIRHSATVANFPFVFIIMDEQRAESLGADARELNNKIIHIRSREKIRVPLFLHKLEYMIYETVFAKFNNRYYKYRFYRSDNILFMYLYKKIFSKFHHYITRLRNTFGYHRLVLESEKGTLDGKFEESYYYLSKKKIYSKRFSTDAFKDIFANLSKLSSFGLEDVPEYICGCAFINELKAQNSYFISDLLANDIIKE